MKRSYSVRVALSMVAMALAFSWGCSREPPPSSDAERQEEGYSSEAERQLNYYGINYHRTLVEAVSDDRALRRLFLVSYLTDGAGSDGYAGDVHILLGRIGEKRFVSVLGSVPLPSQEGVLSLVRYDAGIDQDIPGLAEDFARRYPALWELMN